MLAQRVEVTNSTTTAEGTLSEFGSEALSIRTAPGFTPVRYISNTTTNYVDEAGNPVATADLKSGLPITVYYTKVGDTLFATKIMVRKAAVVSTSTIATTQTTTISSGIISGFSPERIVIRSESSPDPLSYNYSKLTSYVDEEGNPVSLAMVRSGLPVTVNYTRVGDTLIATKVIVRKAATVPVPVIEQKTITIETKK